MARGWESKSVADQMEDAEERAREETEQRANLASSPEMRARYERLESLKLSRARTLTQLERATNQAYRETLLRTLRALEAEIEQLS